MPTICITGATSGIGRATALLFARQGWRCILVGRRREKLEELAQRIEECGTGCLPLQVDVCHGEDVDAALAHLPTDFAAVDVLFNNAGLGLENVPPPVADVRDWDRMIDTNIRGLLHCTRSLLPGMTARGGGHIINTGSLAAEYPMPGISVYSATKAFVLQFARCLRNDLHGTGIRVSTIEPGLTRTEFAEVRFRGEEAGQAAYAHMKPLEAEDIAGMVLWLATLPAHVNVNRLEVMPTCQTFGPLLSQKDQRED